MAALGGVQSMIISVDGDSLSVWGRTKRGAVALGDSSSCLPCPAGGDGLPSPWLAGSCAFDHCCALSDGRVFVFGSNTFGQLGTGNRVGLNAQVALCRDSFGGADVQSVSASGWHTACVTVDGKIFTFGRGTFGQLG